MSVVSGVVWTVCRVWCDVCCVGGRKGRRGEESNPSLTQKQTHPTPSQKRKESPLDFPAVVCYPHCAASCACIIVLLWHKHGCWFFQQRFFFGGGRIGLFLGPIHDTDTLATRNVVSPLRQKHSLRLGHPLPDAIPTHQEFDSPQTRCRTVLDSPVFLCTLHSRALARHNADASGDPQIDCTRRGQFSTCCCSSGRSTKISRCAFRQKMIAWNLHRTVPENRQNPDANTSKTWRHEQGNQTNKSAK